MSEQTEVGVGPYPFEMADLAPDRLTVGAQHTLEDFSEWRNANPDVVAGHIEAYIEQLERSRTDFSWTQRAARRVIPTLGRRFDAARQLQQINYFSAYNLCEIPDPDVAAEVQQRVLGPVAIARKALTRARSIQDFTDGAVGVFDQHTPGLQDTPEARWVSKRLERLYQTLPEAVIASGGMGKVTRTMLGVLTIGAYDVFHEPLPMRRSHLEHILPAAYAYGAAYALIDDTLQDLPSGYISGRDKDAAHRAILRGLQTGERVNPADAPGGPLAEELNLLYEVVRARYPFNQYRHLYLASESMYLAQHRDALLSEADVATQGLYGMYPDIFLKAGMSRVIANIIGRRELNDGFYARAINTTFAGQLKDDFADRHHDRQDGRMTPFTHHTDSNDTNPLYDLFAYDAYVVRQVYKSDVRAADAFVRLGSDEIAGSLAGRTNEAADLLRTYPHTSEIARFVTKAATLPQQFSEYLDPLDILLKKRIGGLSSVRNPLDVDPRTFVMDRQEHIRHALGLDVPLDQPSPRLTEIARYALEAGGKRLRPALTLMMAESLGLDAGSLDPLLRAVEFSHTASLIFDDLPAQDNANLRRGKPATHIAYDEAGAQLAGIAMIANAFSSLSELAKDYPTNRINRVLGYFGGVLGSEQLCQGQDLDLQLSKSEHALSGEDIIEMYRLKTSSLIEAALVPVLILAGRPDHEIKLVAQYSDHTGIVFQLRDDILDATATSDVIGKSAGADLGKANIVRVFGLEEAERRMQEHHTAAVACCNQLPFNTNLLSGIVDHFATRSR